MEEVHFMERLRAGDERVFREIYDRHYELLYRFANRILNDGPLAEEIVDDAIFYLWEHRADLEIIHSVRSYLMRSVYNGCLNKQNSLSYREETRFSSFSLPENKEFMDALLVDSNHPLGLLLEKELENELLRSIEALPEECRTVFKKSRFKQKRYDEIAEELGISVNTVKYHIKHALALLQQRMGRYLQLLLICLSQQCVSNL